MKILIVNINNYFYTYSIFVHCPKYEYHTDYCMLYNICRMHYIVHTAQYDDFEQFYIKDYECTKKMIKSMMLGFEWL